MELRHLRYFVALSESLHFGQAASRLHIAQPSLSHQIQQLETELQTRLLRRTKRRVELTEAGRLFLDEAREILARADRAAVIARRAGRGEAERLRIGVGYCMDQLAISRAVSAFTGKNGAIRVELQTMAVPLQLAAIRDQRLDVGFVRPPVTESSLTSETLISEPVVAALPKNHRLSAKQAMSLSALAEEAFLLVSRESVPIYHDIVLKACREAGFVPDAPHEADQLLMMLGMVAAGSGVALVPAFAREMKPRGVVFASLRPSPATLETAVTWRRENPSRVLTDFIAIARRVLVRSNKRDAP